MPQKHPEYVGCYRMTVTVDIPVEDSIESVARAVSVSEAMQEAAAKLDAELIADDMEWYSDGREEETLGWSPHFEEVARTVECNLAHLDEAVETDIVREHVENELFEPTVEDIDIVSKEIKRRLNEKPLPEAKTQPWCYRVDDTDIGGDGYAAGPFEGRNDAYQAAKAHATWLAGRREWVKQEFDEWTIVVLDPGAGEEPPHPGDNDTVWFYIEQLQEPVESTPPNRSV